MTLKPKTKKTLSAKERAARKRRTALACANSAKLRRSEMTKRQVLFKDAFLANGGNGTQAAIEAGFTEKNAAAQASRLLRDPKVAAALDAGRARTAETLQCTADDIAREMHKLAFSNMEHYMEAGPDGHPRLDFSKLTSDQKAALQEVTVDEYTDGHGKDARDVKKTKFRLADKRASLVDLSRQLGFLKPDKLDVTARVVEVTDAELKALSDEDLAAVVEHSRAVKALLAKGAKT